MRFSLRPCFSWLCVSGQEIAFSEPYSGVIWDNSSRRSARGQMRDRLETVSSLTGSGGGTRLNFLGRCLLCKVQVSGVR